MKLKKISGQKIFDAFYGVIPCSNCFPKEEPGADYYYTVTTKHGTEKLEGRKGYPIKALEIKCGCCGKITYVDDLEAMGIGEHEVILT